jgi:hypothetical protein
LVCGKAGSPRSRAPRSFSTGWNTGCNAACKASLWPTSPGTRIFLV